MVAILLLAGCAREERAFESARSANSVPAYEKFLADYPAAKRHSEAEKLLEELLWSKARDGTVRDDLDAYLHRFPTGAHGTQATQALMKLDWQEADKGDSIAGFRAFMSKWPRGGLEEEALRRIDDLDWKAVDKKVAADLKAFLRANPDGRHYLDAAAALNELLGARNAPTTIRYDYWMYSLPVMVAYHRGYFARRDLAVVLVEGTRNPVRLDQDGWTMLAGVPLGELRSVDRIQHKLKFSHAQYVTTASPIWSALVARRESGLTAVAQLKGKVINEAGGSAPLLDCLEKNGLHFEKDGQKDPEAVTVLVTTNGVFPDQITADAYLVSGYQFNRMEKKSPGAFVVLEHNLEAKYVADPFYTGIDIFNAAFMQQQPETVAGIVAAIDEAVDYIRAHPAEARLVWVNYGADKDLMPLIPLPEYLKSDDRVYAAALRKCGFDSFREETYLVGPAARSPATR